MRYHIVFHDDIDGIICASIFLRQTVKGSPYQLHPTSSSKRSKLQQIINSMGIHPSDHLSIFDYEYNQHANLWIDHHFNPNMGPQAIANSAVVYNPSSKSAARLMAPMVSASGHPTSFLDMVDKIDTADYPNCEYIFSSDEPLMILQAFLSSPRDHHAVCRIVESVSRSCYDIKEAIATIGIGYDNVEETRASAIKSKKFTTVFMNTSLIMQRWPEQFPKYAEYLNFPNIQYAMRISPVDASNSTVHIGSNPWMKNNVNIGSILRESPLLKNGGGHFNVGGGLIEKSNIDEFVETVVETLNLESTMIS